METRYSKDQLLEMFRAQEKSGQAITNLSDLFVGNWSPGIVNGASNGGWGKREDHKEATGPDICWDHEGSVHPMGLTMINDDEREVV